MTTTETLNSKKAWLTHVLDAAWTAPDSITQDAYVAEALVLAEEINALLAAPSAS